MLSSSSDSLRNSHCFLLVSLGENQFLLLGWKQIEQLGRGDDINVQAKTGIIDQRQCLRDKRICHAGALEDQRAIRASMHRTQTVNPAGGGRGRG